MPQNDVTDFPIMPWIVAGLIIGGLVILGVITVAFRGSIHA